MLFPGDTVDHHRLVEVLAGGFHVMDLPYNIHSTCYIPEGGKALAIRVSFPTEIKIRLVSHADEEL